LAAQVQTVLQHDPYLCVGRYYVAAVSQSANFRGFSGPSRHIIYTLSSNRKIASFALNRAGCLPETAA
jgi:hypothetical protein